MPSNLARGAERHRVFACGLPSADALKRLLIGPDGSYSVESAPGPEPSVAWCKGDLGCEAYTGSRQAV